MKSEKLCRFLWISETKEIDINKDAECTTQESNKKLSISIQIDMYTEVKYYMKGTNRWINVRTNQDVRCKNEWNYPIE